MKDLGWMNSWGKDPEEYTKCREQKHDLKGKDYRNCTHDVWCETCDIIWHYDSGD